MTKDDLASTVMDQGRASVSKMMEGEAGYVACWERSIKLALSKVCEDSELCNELWSLLMEGESGTRRYEGGKARSKQR